jgi:hypothetical protein
MSRFIYAAFLLFAFHAHAGYIEVGASANFHLSQINPGNYQKVEAYTGSLSYYFFEMSALELSYTAGRQISVITIDNTKFVTTALMELIGLDLVLTFAGKESPFQPYIKGGAIYQKKEMSREVVGLVPPESIGSPSGIAPSGGVGFRWRMGGNFSLKVGLDTWTTPVQVDPVTFDYMGRAGISWMF